MIWWTAAVRLVAQTPAENRLAATTKFSIRARLGVLFEEVIPVALVHRAVVSLGRAVARRAFSAFDVHGCVPTGGAEVVISVSSHS